MRKINIKIGKLIEKIEVKETGSCEEVERKITDAILNAVSFGASLDEKENKETCRISKIEIVEKYHFDDDKTFGPVKKIERTIYWDGEEIYKEITEPMRKSFSPLGNFMEWILFKRNPESNADGCKVCKNVRKPFGFLRKVFGK
ncbi:hypothetical protein [Arachidicoccus soli]|uniref:Uncharacterized protein n=1 Tax=Arachidicoccus soli TaxID=2341117 RepID=A0A386HQZ7_9BACT|nr:hypothetical protein [Arachidicoccus soli]AYD48193.1 hypothetical protein D6B99_11655 [Arachidicoccus soli]